MSQEPVTITYSLESVLEKITQKLDRLDQKFDQKFEQLDQKFDQKFEQLDQKFDQKFGHLQQEITEIKMGQVKIEEKMDGLAKRIDNQEFLNRGVLVGLILAFLAGLAKVFGIISSP